MAGLTAQNWTDWGNLLMSQGNTVRANAAFATAKSMTDSSASAAADLKAKQDALNTRIASRGPLGPVEPIQTVTPIKGRSIAEAAEVESSRSQTIGTTQPIRGKVTPQLLAVADQLGMSEAEATSLANLKPPTRPTGSVKTGRQTEYTPELQERTNQQSVFDSYNEKNIQTPEQAIVRNLSLVGDISKVDLTDPYALSQLSKSGTFEGFKGDSKNLLTPNKANLASKAISTATPLLAGALFSAVSAGAASPLVGALAAGGTSAASKGIMSKFEGGVGQLAKDFGVGAATSLGTSVAKGAFNSLNTGGTLAQGLKTGVFGSGLTQAQVNAAAAAQGLTGGSAVDIDQYSGLSSGTTGNFNAGGDFVSLDTPDFNDLDAQNFGPLSSNFDLAGTPGYNPSEDVSVYNASIDDLGGPFSSIEASQSFDPGVEQAEFFNQEPIDGITNATGIAPSGLSVGMDGALSPDFAGIDGVQTGSVGAQPEFMDTSDILQQLGMAAVPGVLGSLASGTQQQNATTGGGGGGGGTISDGLLASLLGIGTGKRDALSDLQMRGIGV